MTAVPHGIARRASAAGRRRVPGGRPPGGVAVDELLVDLVRIRSALAAGLSPAEALGTARDPALVDIAGAVRLGRELATMVDDRAQADAGLGLLVRALAVAEQTGSGGGTGVQQALEAIRATRATDRLLAVKTAQARGTATLMAAVPVVAWLALLTLDPATLGFYTAWPGVLTGVLAAACMLGGRLWSRRLVARAAAAPDATDPLHPPEPALRLRWSLAAALVVAVPVGVLAGPVPGALAGAVTAVGVARPPRTARPDLSGGGTAEVAELLALALAAGVSTPAAVRLVGALGPPAGRSALGAAGRKLHDGHRPVAAFGDTRLSVLGDLLDAVDRFGAPAAPTLREYAAELRAARRAAAEEAAERTQLALVFPTTLLTLPGFALGVVPPLVWAGFAA